MAERPRAERLKFSPRMILPNQGSLITRATSAHRRWPERFPAYCLLLPFFGLPADFAPLLRACFMKHVEHNVDRVVRTLRRHEANLHLAFDIVERLEAGAARAATDGRASNRDLEPKWQRG